MGNTIPLETAMRQARSYEEWHAAAAEHDRQEGMDDWRREAESEDYDWRLLKSRTTILRRLLREKDYEQLVFRLREELHGNLGNMANPELYRHAHIGTKQLVNEYLDEVCDALNRLCDTEIESLPPEKKRIFLKRTARSFGRSALLLSGGASLGLFHLGVIGELIEHDLMPRVITGSSAGAVIGAVLATNDEQMVGEFLHPDYHDYTWSRLLRLQDVVREGGMLDQQVLKGFIAERIPNMTFLESYQQTGKILNISVSPADPHQFPRLLNYLTAPNVLVRSAALASSAVPGLFPPVQLRARNFEGRSVAYMPQNRWIDGSVHEDIPKEKVNRLHNVNHYIVSQTNPHVVPFLTDELPDPGLKSFLQDVVIRGPMLQLEHLLETANRHFDIPGMTSIIKKTHAVVRQNYSGDITIYPNHSLTSLRKALRNATPYRAEKLIMEGRRATWPQIERIRNTTQISRTFDACLRRMDQRFAYVPSEGNRSKRASNG
jgi:NTE family protein